MCIRDRVHLSSRIEHTTNKRRVNCLNTAKGMGSENGMVVVKGKRRRVRIWTRNVSMHLWISLTTALEAEGIWIVTLTVYDHTQSQPIPISEWRGRGGDEVWVAFEWVEGAERELVVFFWCFCQPRVFLLFPACEFSCCVFLLKEIAFWSCSLISFSVMKSV